MDHAAPHRPQAATSVAARVPANNEELTTDHTRTTEAPRIDATSPGLVSPPPLHDPATCQGDAAVTTEDKAPFNAEPHRLPTDGLTSETSRVRPGPKFG